jgi:hypothetical protein
MHIVSRTHNQKIIKMMIQKNPAAETKEAIVLTI